MTVDYELRGHVAVLTINRPDARNAVNTDVAQGIEAGLDRLEEDPEARVGIITGARTEKGYIFCAGADLKQMSVDPGGMSTAKGGFGGLVQRERTKPLIAAVDGPALAGGTELPLGAPFIGLLDGGQPCALLPVELPACIGLFPALAEHRRLAGDADDASTMVQLAWPDPAGVLPWEDGFAAELAPLQVLIGDPPGPRAV